MKLKGRYINDRKLVSIPGGAYEEELENGLVELKELDVITMYPRIRKARKPKSELQKCLIVGSMIIPMITFVIFAELLVMVPQAFFAALGAAFGWPAFVYWANVKDS